MATIITMPKRKRAGSITDEQVQEVHDVLTGQELGAREAVVVVSGLDSENTARNRARTLAVMYAERYDVALSAHAVPDPNADGKYVGAVTIRPETPGDPEQAAERDSRTLTELADAAETAGITVQGTGRNGRVLRRDYINALDAISAQQAA